MADKLWFKARLFGWGWTPVTKEGWLVTLVFVFLVFLLGRRAEYLTSQSDILLHFVLPLALLILILLGICYKKGERPRWRWGR